MVCTLKLRQYIDMLISFLCCTALMLGFEPLINQRLLPASPRPPAVMTREQVGVVRRYTLWLSNGFESNYGNEIAS